MLHYFTWQAFLVAALILTIAWYAVIILLFYRKELNDFLSGNTATLQPEPLTHAWDEDFEDNPLADEENLVGKPVMPEGMSRLSMSQFGFAPNVKDAGIEDDAKETALGLIPDVVEELKSIFYILNTEHGNKEDFISLFALVSSKYPKIRNSSNQQALNDYIRENLAFEISNEELDKLWV